MRRLTLAGCLLLVGACAGIVATSDPLTKLNDAQVLFGEKDRPVPAEMLIVEALDIYKRRDDAHGLGNGYREYGDFLRSQSVVRWESAYRRNGFLDKSITFDNRLTKAKDFYSLALEYYGRAATQHIQAGQYDALTNVYFNMAWSHFALGETNQACGDFDRTVVAYEENIRRNPSAKPNIPPRFSSLPEAVAHAKQSVGCPSQ